MGFDLNLRAGTLVESALTEPERLSVARVDAAAQVWDFGIDSPGGLAAGVLLARVCLADLAEVAIVPGQGELSRWPAVTVQTDQPVAACMASQYAGWQIAGDDYFAMGSGPMRAAAGKEELFADIGHQEQPDKAVGVLETGQLPTADVGEKIATDCGVSVGAVTLLAARTASLAGTVQIVARSVETALHKLHELGFDLGKVRCGFGVAPLPPVARNDMAAIGRTNDAVLYGGRVTLWVRAEDDELAQIGPQVPSSASPDYGRPFAEVFAAYDHDFYKIDPHLFSPAEVTLMNLTTGRSFRFGQVDADVLLRSFEPRDE